METIYVIDLIELYSIIAGLIVVAIVFIGLIFYWLWEEHLCYLWYKLKRKIKKV